MTSWRTSTRTTIRRCWTNYFCAFIISGNLALALRWINSGMKESPEEMATLAGEIIMHGVQILQTKTIK